MDNKMTKEEATLYLLKCLVHDKSPEEEKLRQMDLDGVYKFAQFHKITGCLGYVLRNSNVDSKWDNARNNAIYKTIMFDNERSKLTEYMNENGIWYCCLKGVVIQNLYPEYGIRDFSDNDILFDSTYSKQIKQYMLDNGYEVKTYGKGHHDVYHKKPFYDFEMHTKLFDQMSNDEVFTYFKDIREKLQSIEGYEYAFSKDDFYVYFIAHAFKHYDGSGTGLRTLLDVLLYNNHNNLDYEYITSELKKINLDNKEKVLRSLSYDLLYGDNEINYEEETMLNSLMAYGAYGTLENRINNKIKGKKSIGKYISSRLFPDEKLIAAGYPYAVNRKYLYPVVLIHRLIKSVTVSRKHVLNELRILSKMNKKR